MSTLAQRNYVKKALESSTGALTAQEVAFVANAMAGTNWGTAAITARIREIKDDAGNRQWRATYANDGRRSKYVYTRVNNG